MAVTDPPAMIFVTGIPCGGQVDGHRPGRPAVPTRRPRQGPHLPADGRRRPACDDLRPHGQAWRQLRLRLAAPTADSYYEAGSSVVVQDVVIGPLLTTYVDAIRSRPLARRARASARDQASREAARTKVAYNDEVAITALTRSSARRHLGSDCGSTRPFSPPTKPSTRSCDVAQPRAASTEQRHRTTPVPNAGRSDMLTRHASRPESSRSGISVLER